MEQSYKVCIEMLNQREYEILEQQEDFIRAKKPDGDFMCVFVTDISKFNNVHAQKYIGIMNDIEIEHSIIVYKNNVTSAVKNIKHNFQGMRIELFSQEELQYNITTHKYQPKFEILNAKDSERFKKIYDTKFPIMLKTDPIARFYGYQKGDVVKVTRKNGYVMYRIVQ
jgi:DNA-directed RNA polymerase I, II, and III subunit RPABC1